MSDAIFENNLGLRELGNKVKTLLSLIVKSPFSFAASGNISESHLEPLVVMFRYVPLSAGLLKTNTDPATRLTGPAVSWD